MSPEAGAETKPGGQKMGERYPRLEINLAHLKHNVSKVVEKCDAAGIQVAGVIKGATGMPEVAKAFEEGGAAFLASSRLEQLEDAEKYGMILRAKGIVAGADGKWIHFDYVPGTPDVRTGSASTTGRLCVIGSHIQEDALAALFRTC